MPLHEGFQLSWRGKDGKAEGTFPTAVHTVAWELMLEGVGLHATPDSSITLAAARKGGGLQL